MIEVTGKGYAYFETGTEGVIWAIEDPEKEGYDGLYILKDGDNVIVYDKEDPSKVVWEGVVQLEYQTHAVVYDKRYPETHKQQAILGCWIHGLQVGLAGEAWAKWFLGANPMKLQQHLDFEYIQKKEDGSTSVLDRKRIAMHAANSKVVGDEVARIDLYETYLRPKTPYPHYLHSRDKWASISLNKEALESFCETAQTILAKLADEKC